MDHRMTPAPISVDRLRELLAVMTGSDPNRMTDFPGRCDCHECGCIFIGGDGHDYCAQCEAKRKLLAALPEALPALLHQLAELQANLAELRQACWDARALLGFDNDGDPTPDALVYPSLADLVRRDAAEFRKDYDEACSEVHAAERAREEAQEEAATERALQRAAGKLPDGWEISVVVENGAGWVTLHDPEGELVEFEDSDRTIAQQVTEATDTAIAAFLAASGGEDNV